MLRLQDFKPLGPAETKLIDAAPTGERVIIGDGTVPADTSPENTIRAGLIRMLLLQRDPDFRLHEKGLRLRGAFVSGTLDLQGCDCHRDLSLSRCRIEKQPSFLNARMRGLYLNGSHCPGISAESAVFDGSVFLRYGFVCTDEIALPGTEISGDLQICDATLSSKGGHAIFAASIRVGGSVYLGDYPYDEQETELHAHGSLIFASAQISGDFFCRQAAIAPEGDSFVDGPQQDGTEGDNLTALSLVRADIQGVLLLKDNQISGGIVNLSGAQVRRLNDDVDGTGAAYRIRLDGFEYQDFAQHADTSVKTRLAWLERRPEGIGFRAQPYEQLARILNRIGHRDDAREVLMRKEAEQRRANLQLARERRYAWLWVPLLAVQNLGLRFLTGYGYRPSLALFWAVLLMLGFGFAYQKMWDMGDMTPNSAPILVSKDWVSATRTHPQNPGDFWSAEGQAGQDYETFNAFAYAADLLIPIVNLGQEDAWAPSTSRSWWGQQGWWLRWVAKVFGWVLTALGAAAVTGVIRRD